MQVSFILFQEGVVKFVTVSHFLWEGLHLMFVINEMNGGIKEEMIMMVAVKSHSLQHQSFYLEMNHCRQ